MKILLVDDDRDLVDLLTFALRRAGMDTAPAYDSPMALRAVDQDHPDLAVIDINLGGWDGFELLKEVRKRSQIPVIMLTGRAAEEDKVRGLELGADDYLTKPFSHRELIARIRARLRGQGEPMAPEPIAPVQVGPISLNPGEHSATKDGERLELTVTEFRLLHYLMLNAGSVVPSRTLLRQVWGYDDPSASATLRVTVHRLRRKLGDDSVHSRLLHTVSGIGVMLKVEAGEP